LKLGGTQVFNIVDKGLTSRISIWFMDAFWVIMHLRVGKGRGEFSLALHMHKFGSWMFYKKESQQ
jgi:hypothetical protein